MIGLSKDGRWMQFSQVQPHLYMAMLKAMGLDWMLADDEWKNAVWAMDPDKSGEFWDKLTEAANSKTLGEWQQVFEADHDVWAETMRRGSELLDHPQMQHLGAVVEIDDAERGRVRQPGPIARLSETPARLGPRRPGARRRRRRPAGEPVAGPVRRRGPAGLDDSRARRRDHARARNVLCRAVRRHRAA